MVPASLHRRGLVSSSCDVESRKLRLRESPTYLRASITFRRLPLIGSFGRPARLRFDLVDRLRLSSLLLAESAPTTHFDSLTSETANRLSAPARLLFPFWRLAHCCTFRLRFSARLRRSATCATFRLRPAFDHSAIRSLCPRTRSRSNRAPPASPLVSSPRSACAFPSFRFLGSCSLGRANDLDPCLPLPSVQLSPPSCLRAPPLAAVGFLSPLSQSGLRLLVPRATFRLRHRRPSSWLPEAVDLRRLPSAPTFGRRSGCASQSQSQCASRYSSGKWQSTHFA